MKDLTLEKLLKRGFVALLAVALGLVVWISRHPRTLADKLGFVPLASVPHFTLTDEQGRPFDSASLKGKVWVAAFIYTRCRTSCPLLTYQMAQLQKQWAGQPDFRLVSITVDPLHDKPSVLLGYAKAYGADLKTWSFLTGPPNTVYPLIEKGFLAKVNPLTVEEKGKVVSIPHSTDVEVIGRHGCLRGVFEGVLPSEWTRLDTAIGALLKEKA